MRVFFDTNDTLWDHTRINFPLILRKQDCRIRYYNSKRLLIVRSCFVIFLLEHFFSSEVNLKISLKSTEIMQNTKTLLMNFSYTGCKSRIRKMVEVKIWKEPMLVLKQTIPQQKALDFSFNLAPWKWAWHYHEAVTPSRRRTTFFTLRGTMLFAARGRSALLIKPRPFLGSQIKAEIKGFLLMYCLFLYYLWFFQNIEKGWRKIFEIRLFPQFLKMTKIIKKYFLQPFSIFWKNHCYYRDKHYISRKLLILAIWSQKEKGVAVSWECHAHLAQKAFIVDFLQVRKWFLTLCLLGDL